jgi:hypothetical protein
MPDANPNYGRSPEQIAADEAGESGDGSGSEDWSADRQSPEPWAADGSGSGGGNTENGSHYSF